VNNLYQTILYLLYIKVREKALDAFVPNVLRGKLKRKIEQFPLFTVKGTFF
jgi:hypothetical protein